jgi:hypothetical protein
MNPKGKAKNLVKSFMKYASTNDEDYEMKGAKNDYHNAKKCALIAVKLVLKSGCVLPMKQGHCFFGNNNEAIDYWDEVIIEINKL